MQMVLICWIEDPEVFSKFGSTSVIIIWTGSESGLFNARKLIIIILCSDPTMKSPRLGSGIILFVLPERDFETFTIGSGDLDL